LEEKSLRRTCADALGPEATLAAVPQEPSPRRPGASAGWIVRLPGERGTLCITAEAGRYKSADGDFRTPRFSQAALDQAMAEHRAWLCVAVCAENGDGAGRLFHAACRLAAGLVDDHALAVYVPEVGRLAPADAAAREGLLADEPKKMLCSLGEPAVLYRDAPDETPPGADRERRARLKALASALAGPGPVKEPVVRVELWMGSLSESVRVALDRRVRFGGDDHLFRGRVLDQSRLFPELRPGEPVSVLPDEIVAWEQTHGE